MIFVDIKVEVKNLIIIFWISGYLINCNKYICIIVVIIYKRVNEMSVYDLCRVNGSNWFLVGKVNY